MNTAGARSSTRNDGLHHVRTLHALTTKVPNRARTGKSDRNNANHNKNTNTHRVLAQTHPCLFGGLYDFSAHFHSDCSSEHVGRVSIIATH